MTVENSTVKSLTFEEFEQTINSLKEEDRKTVFEELEASRQMMVEAQILYNSVISYLKLVKAKNEQEKNNG